MDRGAQGTQRGEVPHVAHDDPSTGCQQLEGAVEHVTEVVLVGEVLDHRVQDDGVEEPGGKPLGVVRCLAPQHHPVVEPGVGDSLRQPVHRGSGEVGAPVLLAVRGHLGQDQAGTDPDLQDPAGPQPEDPVHGGGPPLPHLVQRNGLTRVGVVPAREVLAEGGVALRGVDGVVGLPPLLDRVAESPAFQVHRVGWRDVPGQSRISRAVLADHDDGLPHVRVGAQGGLDLARFDPEPAELDLVVGSPQELQLPGRGPPHHVARAVHAATGPPEGVGHESAGGQSGAVQVTSCQQIAGHVQLTRNTRGDQAQPLVEDVDGVPRERGTDGCRPTAQRAAHGGADRRLRRSVGVDQQASQCPPLGQIGRQRLTRHDDHRQVRHGPFGNRRQHRRWNRQVRDPVRGEDTGQLLAAELFVAGHDQCRTGSQRHDQLPHRGVEAG